MKKTSLIISSMAVITLSLAGCGGGGSSTTPQTATTDTGYYVDSAVAGVNYICGSQTGTTDKDGKFTFEKGQDCTFELAGITLKKIPSDNLVDNAKVVENNVSVARFLQSIDNDGNPSNGIQITEKISTVLTKALQTENIKTVPDDTIKLDTVVSHIEQEDDSFKGHVVTEEEAQNHLQSTQESIIKNMLSGKTFYYVKNDDFGHEEQAGFNLAKIELNTDGTLVWTEIDTIDANQPHNSTYHIKNNHLFLFGNDEGSGEYKFSKQTNDYIEFDELDKNNNPAYLFSDETKAKNFRDKMNQ